MAENTLAISERAQSLRYQNIERLLPPTHSAWAQMCLWANIMLASHLMIMDKTCSEFFEQKLPWNLKFKIKLNIPTSYPVLCQLKVPNSNILLLSGIHDGSKKSQIKFHFTRFYSWFNFADLTLQPRINWAPWHQRQVLPIQNQFPAGNGGGEMSSQDG